jgi:hypothetical protein
MKQFSRIPVAVLLLAFALPALAQKPTITETPFTTPFVISGGAANGACNFDVLVAPQEGRPNRERTIQFAKKMIVVGPLFVTLTNLSTQKTANLNISGPTVVNFTGGTTSAVFMGPTLVAELPPNLATAAGLPPVAAVNGRTILMFDAQGVLTSVTFTGTEQDVCQLLQ